MSGILKISEGASLALHTMALLAIEPENRLSVKNAAKVLGASGNHLSKIMQRLTKAGLVRSIRGPSGGFTLGRAPEEISLMEIYEVIEGPYEPEGCLLGLPICDGTCIFGGFMNKIDREFREYLTNTHLGDMVEMFRQRFSDSLKGIR